MGKVELYINWIQICRRNKAGRAGFAMSKMVARACNLPKQISSSVLQNLPQFWCVAAFSLHLRSFSCFYLCHSLIFFSSNFHTHFCIFWFFNSYIFLSPDFLLSQVCCWTGCHALMWILNAPIPFPASVLSSSLLLFGLWISCNKEGRYLQVITSRVLCRALGRWIWPAE